MDLEIPPHVPLDESQKLMLGFMKTINANMEKQFTCLNSRLDQYSNMFAEMDNKLTATNKQTAANMLAISELQTENAKLRTEVNQMRDKCVRLESQSRRENLIFSGVSENQPEDCEEKIRFIVKNKLGILDDISIERCHRLGPVPRGGNKPRNIIVKFSRFPERQAVWHKRRALDKTKFGIFEDFPDEIQRKRNALKPALRRAIELKKTAYLAVDKLVVDNKVYTTETMDSLPDEINPAKLATPVVAPDLIAFFGNSSPLSNFHVAQFEIDGKAYDHVEQYYQYERAKYYNDAVSAQAILSMKSPYDCYFASKRVNLPHGVVNDDGWRGTKAIPTMQRACAAKFQQNVSLGHFLLATKGKSLVEANSNDCFWGAGLSLRDKDLPDRTKWKGHNHLGAILEQIRDKLV